MGHIREEFYIEAPIEAVWDLGTDPTRLTEYQPSLVKVEKPTYLEYKATTPGGGKGTIWFRNERSGTGTKAMFEMDYELPGGFVGDIADKLFMERQIERDIKYSNENFKALCEAKVPAHV